MRTLKNVFEIVIIGLLITLFAFIFGSCKTMKEIQPNCKHSILIPVTFQTDSFSFYTVDVPFCDTISLTRKPKKNE